MLQEWDANLPLVCSCLRHSLNSGLLRWRLCGSLTRHSYWTDRVRRTRQLAGLRMIGAGQNVPPSRCLATLILWNFDGSATVLSFHIEASAASSP